MRRRRKREARVFKHVDFTNRGYELYDWDVTDGNLTMSNFDLEGYYQDGEMVLDDGKVKLYFKKSNEHLIYPYHEEEE